MSDQVQSYTITRALAELKMLDKRINRKISSGVYVSQATKNNRRKGDPINKASEHYQSVMDLIRFRNSLKALVVASNASTVVKINGRTYTVAEAIERKSSIGYEKSLLNILKQQRLSAKNQVEQHNQRERGHLQKLMEANFGRDQSKVSKDDLNQMEQTFWENNKCELIDPLKIDEIVSQLETEIEGFETEVDFVLSESNSQTHITLP